MWRLVRPGWPLFVRDLIRPESMGEVRKLVVQHGGAPFSREPNDVAS